MSFRISVEGDGMEAVNISLDERLFNENKLETLAIGNLSQGKKVEIRIQASEPREEIFVEMITKSITNHIEDRLKRMGFNSQVEVEESKIRLLP